MTHESQWEFPDIPMPTWDPAPEELELMGVIGYWVIRNRACFEVLWMPEFEGDRFPWYAELKDADGRHDGEDWVGGTPLEVMCVLVERWGDRFGSPIPPRVVAYLDEAFPFVAPGDEECDTGATDCDTSDVLCPAS